MYPGHCGAVGLWDQFERKTTVVGSIQIQEYNCFFFALITRQRSSLNFFFFAEKWENGVF